MTPISFSADEDAERTVQKIVADHKRDLSKAKKWWKGAAKDLKKLVGSMRCETATQDRGDAIDEGKAAKELVRSGRESSYTAVKATETMDNQKIARELVRLAKELVASGSDPMDGLRLPKDLTKMSSSQTQKAIDYLASLPLRDLRKRQELVSRQQERAFQDGNDFAMGNLRVMDDVLMMAVDKKEFGD